MQIKQELITRLILALGLVFIGGKIIAALLESFGRGSSNKGGFKDLDKMVQQQKNMMRFDQGLAQKAGHETPAAGGNSRQSKSKSAYQKAGDNAMVTLIDGLQWGGGDEYSAVAQRLHEEYSLLVDTTKLGQYFGAMINRDFLLKFNPLPTRDQVDKLIELRALLEVLLDELALDAQGGPVVESVARQKSISTWESARGLEMVLLSDDKSGSDLLKHVLNKNGAFKGAAANKKSDLIWKQLISGDRPASLSLFISRLDRHLPSLAPFSPLPAMQDKNDVEGALRLFGFNSNPGDEELKKQYKKLASQRHPDRLSGMKLDAELSKRANDNFTRIQAAWDLLKK